MGDAVVIIPTYNEAETIQPTLAAVRDSAPAAHVLVVDDGSPDGTAELVRSVADSRGGISVLPRAEKEGLGPAYAAGFQWGLERGFDKLVEMDADGSHDPACLPRLLARCDQSADLVIGSRYAEGGSVHDWGWHRRALSRAGNVYASALLGLGVRDATSGYRAYRASLLERIDLDGVKSSGYCFQIELTYRAARAGATIAEEPIVFTDRAAGHSKMAAGIVGEAFWHVTRWGASRLKHFLAP
jgi:dolichol-phosphate mannosyltransferase